MYLSMYAPREICTVTGSGHGSSALLGLAAPGDWDKERSTEHWKCSDITTTQLQASAVTSHITYEACEGELVLWENLYSLNDKVL